jgi:hypothetical protein
MKKTPQEKRNEQEIKELLEDIRKISESKNFGIFYMWYEEGRITARMKTIGAFKSNLRVFLDTFMNHINLQELNIKYEKEVDNTSCK